jgi:hypothetical protein
MKPEVRKAKQVVTYVDPATFDQLEAIATRHGVARADLVRRLLTWGLQQDWLGAA